MRDDGVTVDLVSIRRAWRAVSDVNEQNFSAQ
jgi:hypothetical protein